MNLLCPMGPVMLLVFKVKEFVISTQSYFIINLSKSTRVTNVTILFYQELGGQTQVCIEHILENM